MRLQRPEMLLCLVPISLVLLGLARISFAGLSLNAMRCSFALRAIVVSLLLLALAGLSMQRVSDRVTVIYALDRSRSMPADSTGAFLKAITVSAQRKQADDKVGLLGFGRNAAFEVWPTETFEAPHALQTQIDPEQTDLAEALRKARDAVEEGSGARIILFTDGLETGGRALDQLMQMSGADVWFVQTGAPPRAEMLLEKIQAPALLRWEQPFDVHVFVQSTVTAPARLTFFTGEQRIEYPEVLHLRAGMRMRVTFPGLKLTHGGPAQLEALLEPLHAGDDTYPQNNHVYAFTEVETDTRVLLMTSDLAEVEHLEKTLRTQKLSLDVRTSLSLPEDPEQYRHYDAIILANLGRGYLSAGQMEVIESCVKDQGAGLVMIGGDQSFGAGGYLGTPVERALPVRMDLENQRVLPRGALEIVLDCSGSMAESADGKLSKQEIANQAAEKAIASLYSGDWAGVVAFNERAFTTLQLQALTDPARAARAVRGLTPGGGTDIEAGLEAGYQALERLPSEGVAVKHLVLVTDGQSPGQSYDGIVARMAGSKITVSTVGVGPDQDRAVLERIARKGQGRFYSVTDARTLPQILIKEAAVVRKNLIHTSETGVPVRLAMRGEMLRNLPEPVPPLKALVVTNIKDRAERLLDTTIQGERVPVMAAWQYGLGRSVAFTGDATNRWSPQWVGWKGYETLWASTLQWVARHRMPGHHAVQILRDGNLARVRLEAFDEHGDYRNFAELSATVLEPGMGSDPDAASERMRLPQIAPGLYEGVFPLRKVGAYTVTITDSSNPRLPETVTTGLANSYSPEYLPSKESTLVSQLAAWPASPEAAGLPRVRIVPLGAFQKNGGLDPFVRDFPKAQITTDLFWPLLLLTLLIFPIDVAARRLRFDPALFARRFRFWRVQSITGAKNNPVEPPALALMPQGNDERRASYEAQGNTPEAQAMELDGSPHDGTHPIAGGTKLTTPDDQASAYTRALLNAKRRSRKRDG